MRESLRDPLRLDHIFNSIQTIQNNLENLDFKNLEEHDLRYFGIVKLLEIIGEASYMLTKEFKETHPQTPWKQIIDMRHILVHGYYSISKGNVEKVLKEDLPVLKNQISLYLKEFN